MVQPAPEYWRKIALELKLRKLSGDAFQDFFSDVMEQLHGDDFVRVRAYGSKGDKGCDGYLKSTGQVFQCYGAVAGAPDKVKTLVTKMTDDFGKAREHLSDIMKEWHMVHNIVDGLPTEAIQALKSLEDSNPDISFGFVGVQGFEARLNELALI